MMSLAIAHEIRSQVVFANDPIIVPSQYRFNVERQAETHYDWGETISVV
jgi:hypothetical protein